VRRVAGRGRGMTDDEPAAIARKMTPAGKRAFFLIGTNPAAVSFDARLWLTRGRLLLEPAHGWAINDTPWQYTHLGLRVRAVLEQEGWRDE
jgi:hypothetical protein